MIKQNTSINSLLERSRAKVKSLEEEAKNARNNAEKAQSNLYRLERIRKEYGSLMHYSNAENRIIAKDGTNWHISYLGWDKEIPEQLPLEIRTILSGLRFDFDKLYDKSKLCLTIGEIIGRISQRKMTQEEYESIINGTHAGIKEYVDYRNASDERISRYKTSNGFKSPFIYAFYLTSYDHSRIRKEKSKFKFERR